MATGGSSELWGELRYQSICKLGKGSFGSVFKARDKVTGGLVALKQIQLEEDEGMAEIEKEIAILKDCKHPNVVAYMGSNFFDNCLWIAMEYCGGGSCSDLLDLLDEPFTEDEIGFIMIECLKGLEYLHSCRKIHRDIKGGNILLTDTGDVKLADFGVSAQLSNTLSARNTFVGTPYWMAPEIVLGTPYGTPADIWSIGITAIELAQKKPPHSGIHPMRAIFLIPYHAPPTLEKKEAFSAQFNDFIAKCLVKEPKDRSTAKDLRSHEFFAKQRNKASLVERIERASNARDEAAEARRSMGLESDDSDEEFHTANYMASVSSSNSSHFASSSGTVVDSGTFVDRSSGTFVDRSSGTFIDRSSGTFVERPVSGTFVEVKDGSKKGDGVDELRQKLLPMWLGKDGKNASSPSASADATVRGPAGVREELI